MFNLIVMLILMSAPALAASAWNRFGGRPVELRAAAAAGLGLVFLFTASGHFILTGAMVQMLPAWVPQRTLLVHATGLLELAIALGFFLPRWRRAAGIAAVTVLALFFPANIYAAFQHVPIGGHEWGPAYLLLRAPVQLILMAWTYGFVLRDAAGTRLMHRRAGT